MPPQHLPAGRGPLPCLGWPVLIPHDSARAANHGQIPSAHQFFRSQCSNIALSIPSLKVGSQLCTPMRSTPAFSQPRFHKDTAGSTPYLAHAESQVLPWSPLLGVTNWAPQEMDSDPHRLSFLPGVYQKCPKDQCLLEARIARGTCQASSQGALEPEWTQAERAGPLTLRQNGCWMEPHGRAWPW